MNHLRKFFTNILTLLIFIVCMAGCMTSSYRPPSNLIPIEDEKVRSTVSRGSKWASFEDKDIQIEVHGNGPVDNHFMFSVVIGNKTDFVLEFRESGLKLEWSNDPVTWNAGRLLSAAEMDAEWKLKWYFNGQYYLIIKRQDILFDNDIGRRSLYRGFVEIDPNAGVPIPYPKFMRLTITIGSKSQSFSFRNDEYLDP